MKNEINTNNYSIMRNFNYWSGYNEFYCNGKIMLGPKGLKLLMMTIIIINLPQIPIFLFSILV